jgi:RNA-binding protein YhbY
VKINGTDRRARQAMAVAICSRTDAVAIHQVGKIVVLWRPTPEDAPASSSE